MVNLKQNEERSSVGWTLRIGAWGSLVLIISGLLLLVAHVSFGEWVLRAGFLFLMFTPAIRILVAGLVFLHEKDYRYAVVSLTVLAIVVVTSTLAML
jgi:uncharacterized membrane protein